MIRTKGERRIIIELKLGFNKVIRMFSNSSLQRKIHIYNEFDDVCYTLLQIKHQRKRGSPNSKTINILKRFIK